MNRSSRMFRKLNRLTACHCSFNRHAVRISRALCEANQALPARRHGCDDCCNRDRCGEDCCDKGCRRRKPFWR